MLNSRKQKDSFSENLLAINENMMNTHRTSIVGGNIEAIITDDVLFEEYKGQLIEGFDFDEREVLDTVLENSRQEILAESTLGQIQPYTALSMPVLVKLWARLALTEALPTEVATTPNFTVPTLVPYVIDKDGKRHTLPESINVVPETLTGLVRIKEDVAVDGGRAVNIDLFDGLVEGKEVRKGIDRLDRKFRVVEATWSDSYDVRTKAAGSVKLQSQTIKLSGDDIIEGTIKYPTDDSGAVQTDQILGKVDITDGTMSIASVSGKLTAIKVEGFVASEQHTSGTNVELGVENKQVVIDTAQHIEAKIPLELVQDLKAMYNIDGTAELTEIMSNLSGQKVDTDIIEFLNNEYEETDAKYQLKFDVYPNSDYSAHPKDWLNGLREVIDVMAQSMRNDFKAYDCNFVIIGNPLDTRLIPNVDWTFQSGAANATNAGIGLNYSLGAVSGTANYTVVGSDLYPQGDLTLIAIPTVDKYKTFMFYPYTFNVVNGGYLNTRNANIPNLMMTRRYTVESFTPIIGKINILNNDGSVYAR